MLELLIGNKNYSSWSMRPWLVLRHAGIVFEERRLSLDFTPDSAFKRTVAQHSPAARVPVLLDDGFAVWDSLAICEYLAERFPGQSLWPDHVQARARARSICAEMHSGFGGVRSQMPMNIELSRPEIGPRVLAEQPQVQAEVQRLEAMFSELLSTHGGPWLFGDWSIADAYFAPVCARFRSYGVPVSAPVSAYINHVWASPAVQAWVQQALAEHEFVKDAEPFRDRPVW